MTWTGKCQWLQNRTQIHHCGDGHCTTKPSRQTGTLEIVLDSCRWPKMRRNTRTLFSEMPLWTAVGDLRCWETQELCFQKCPFGNLLVTLDAEKHNCVFSEMPLWGYLHHQPAQQPGERDHPSLQRQLLQVAQVGLVTFLVSQSETDMTMCVCVCVCVCWSF